VSQKSDVKTLTKDGAIFIDGSYQSFSVILYCTGYRYTFPFLSIDCGLSVNEYCVDGLFKHCLNINIPSMGIIGLPNFVCPNQMFDLQVSIVLIGVQKEVIDFIYYSLLGPILLEIHDRG
jgi:dimethylaniline monooxygenase (N-oxide forming)